MCAVRTLFMLPGARAQQRCISAAARHLRPGGLLFIEAFRPDASRFDATGCRLEQRPAVDGTAHEVHSRHEPGAHAIHITHVFTSAAGSSAYEVTLHYATPGQIDVMAAAAGLTLQARWHDWTAAPATDASRDPISVYRRNLRPPRREAQPCVSPAGSTKGQPMARKGTGRRWHDIIGA